MGFQNTVSVIQPSIEIGGVKISEPVIALTDILVVIVGLYAWNRLKHASSPPESKSFFRYFLFLTAISALLGAIFGHAFVHIFDFGGKIPSWVFSMIGVGCLAQGSLLHTKNLHGDGNLRKLIGSIWLIFGVLVVVAIVELKFLYAEIYIAYCYLLLLGISEFRYLRKHKDRSSYLLLLSLLFVIAAALAHGLKLSLGVWFSYFDIGHVLVCGSLWYVMLAVEAMQEKPALVAQETPQI
jgi:hypothetical protein